MIWSRSREAERRRADQGRDGAAEGSAMDRLLMLDRKGSSEATREASASASATGR